MPSDSEASTGGTSFTEIDYDALVQYEAGVLAADAEGGFETCTSADYSWFLEAEADVQRYDQALEQADAPSEGRLDSTGSEAEDDLSANRGTSYDGWEDDCLSDWQPERILKRTRKEGVLYYLVKWRSHPDTTWETAEDLEEEGHKPLLVAFDQAKAQKGEAQSRASNRRVRRNLQSTFNPLAFWPDFLERIVDRFRATAWVPVAVHNVLKQRDAAEFMKHWHDHPDFVPAMLFHGTSAAAIPSIVNTGLQVPGSHGVQVANGSAHGVGIYTATEPSLSMLYVRNCSHLFVCAGLVGGEFQSTTKSVGNMCVFFDRRRVVPCFLVEFARSADRSVMPTYIDHFDPTAFAARRLPSVAVQELRARYIRNAIAASTTNEAVGPRAEPRAGMRFDNHHRTLTKRQLRAAPRAAKEAYKAGMLLQPKR